MKPLSLITGFLPWIAFSLISTRMAGNGVAWSALIAVAITIVAMAIARPAWPPKILNVGSAVLFGVIAIVGFVGGPDVDLWLYTWAAPGVGVALGLFVLATVPFMPFTEQYARESTPRAYWGSPTFKKINRVLSLAWGVAITVMGMANIAVSALDLRAHLDVQRQPAGAVPELGRPDRRHLVHAEVHRQLPGQGDRWRPQHR